jgi:SAM-dependent methyltransferase
MASQNQDKLRAHFEALPDAAHGQGWDALWADSTFLPWDRGNANPALIDLLTSQALHCAPPVSQVPNPSLDAPEDTIPTGLQLPGPIKPDGSRARVLIPGCGKGYDVALFAAHGYDAFGLEISEHAAQAAFVYLANVGRGPLEGEYEAANATRGTDRGKMACFLGDFFSEDWLQVERGEGYDIIYDITVLPAPLLGLKACVDHCLVSMRSSAHASRGLGCSDERPPCSRRYAHLLGVPDTQTTGLGWPAMGAVPCHIYRTVQTARAGHNVRRSRKGCPDRQTQWTRSVGQGCALHATADAPCRRGSRCSSRLCERLAARVDG